jgi:hypothetical protein
VSILRLSAFYGLGLAKRVSGPIEWRWKIRGTEDNHHDALAESKHMGSEAITIFAYSECNSIRLNASSERRPVEASPSCFEETVENMRALNFPSRAALYPPHIL